MTKTIRFDDYPDFRPNLTPYEMFRLGSFGGTYWRPIKSKFYKRVLRNQHHEFSWSRRLSDDVLVRPCADYDKSINKYNVKVGGYREDDKCGLLDWEKRSWIRKGDPYGWVQWYARFYDGRRSSDDEWQIERWAGVAGPKGRFRLRLIGMIMDEGAKYNDYEISPAIRQVLQHWGYQLTLSDYRAGVRHIEGDE
jgi:hypothetical protein